MEDKYFEVKLEISAPNEAYVERMIDGMPRAERIYDCEIVDPEKRHLEARIRYEKDWNGRGEHYIFENRWSDEDEWGLEVAFKLRDAGEEKGVLLHYEALTKIREWMRLGIPFRFC